MKKITESDLVKVSMVDDFFSIKAILYIDLIEVPKNIDVDKGINVMYHNDKKYIIIALNGEPQNLILNMPIRVNVGGYDLIIGFDAKGLPDCIKRGHIFDFSIFYRNKKYSECGIKGYKYDYKFSHNFLVDNFINKKN